MKIKKGKTILKHLLAILILLLLLLFVFKFEWIYFPRLIISLNSFKEKFIHYFMFLNAKDSDVNLLTNEFLKLNYYATEITSINYSSIGKDFLYSLKLLINFDYLIDGLISFSDFTLYLSEIVLIFTLLVIATIIILTIYLSGNEKSYKETSWPLKAYLAIKKKVFIPPIEILKAFLVRFKETIYFYTALTILIISFNVPSLALDFVGEYFYLFSGFNIFGLLDYLIITIFTVLGSLQFLPISIKIVAIYGVFRYFSILRANRLIEGKLMVRDEKMVNSDTGVFTLILGKMRGGKTTLATSFARISNTIYHKNAFDNMNRVSLIFKDFPYIALEKDIIRLASKHRLVNMEQCASFVEKIYNASLNKPFVLYGYDIKKNKIYHYDGCINISLKDALIIYAESYWIYFHKGNLISSNYPIRTDDIRLDNGHLILWDYNLLKRKNSGDLRGFSSISRVLVFDMLRMGRKINEENIYKDAASPSVLVATEFGKENGNMITNQSYSAQDSKANPKNDLLDYSLKLGGHLANVWHTNFFKFIADEQRSGSVSSNLLNIAQTIYTADPKNQKEKCALKLFYFESFFLDLILKLRNDFYTKYRFVRDDNTLLFRMINALGSLAYSIESYVYNRFGYKECLLPSCTSDSTGNLIEGEKSKFYIIYYIDYALRFESACMKDFLNNKKKKAYRGFFDIPTYKSMMPTKEEWEMQGSYLVQDLENPLLKFNPSKKSMCRNGSRRNVRGPFRNKTSRRN